MTTKNRHDSGPAHIYASEGRNKTTMTNPDETPSATPLLDSLSPQQAAQALRQLVATDPAIAARAEEVAGSILSDVDPDDIAEMLADDLSDLAIEDVWDAAGPTRDGGYIDTTDCAWDMLDEVLEPYTDEMMAYIDRGMPDESRDYCLGILMGIRLFEEMHSSICEEVPDYCSDTFDIVWEEWEEAIGDAEQIALLASLLEEEGLV